MKLHQLINNYKDIEQNYIVLLLEKIFNSKYNQLLLKDDIVFSEAQEKDLNHYIQRLKSNEPIQYILGSWDFIDLKLKVDKRALIPRPETEILAQAGVALARKFNNPQVLDIGCGTGCIGLYIKHVLSDAEVTLCDISADALSLAKENAASLVIDVSFLHQDMRYIDGKYDVIVSNPPYISKKDMALLDKSVVCYEPESALYGGVDGLDFYRTLSVMHKNLTDCGYLAIEIGFSQEKDIKKLLEKNFKDIIIIKDLAGISRVIMAKKA